MNEWKNFTELVLSLAAACVGFLAFVLVGQKLGLAESTLATLCSSAAIFTGAVVAYRAFRLNRKTAQEPWSVVFRELHKEFWNDAEMARVRAWLCSTEAYENELLPILARRKNGPVDTSSHKVLEALDKYCALMVRVSNIPTDLMSTEQLRAYKSLGYDWWLYKITSHEEVANYVRSHWKNLAPMLPKNPPDR
jgi:hypothetical protein